MLKPTNIINGELKIGTIIDLYPDRTYAYNDDNSDEVYPDFKLLYQYLGEERGFGVYTIDGLVDLAITARDFHHDDNTKRYININGSLKCYYDDENDLTFIFPNEAPSQFEYDNVTYYKNNLEFKDILVTEICPYAFCANAWENIPFTTQTFEPFTYSRLEIPATIKHIREDAFKHTKIEGKNNQGNRHYLDVNFISYSCNGIMYEATYSQWAQIEFSSYYSAPFAGTDRKAEELPNIAIDDDIHVSQGIRISGISKISDYAFVAASMVQLGISSVREIGNSAFEYADALETITVDENLQIIGDCAFRHCTNLTEVSGLTDKIKRIGNVAFRNTPILSANSKYYDNAIYYLEGKFQDTDKSCYFALDVRNDNDVMSSSITIKDNTILIADYCFHEQYYITNLYLPQSLKRIGRNAFLSASREYDSVESYNNYYNLSGLENIYYYGGFDEWVQIEFADNASSPFNDNYSAMDGLERINDNGAAYFTAKQAQAKKGCLRTEWVHLYSLCNIPEDHPAEPLVVFNPLASPLSNDGKSRYGWSENYAELTTINAHAFAYCMDIVAIDLSAFPNLTRIGDSAFDNCRNVRNINLNNVLSIGYCAIYDNILAYDFSAPRLLHIGEFGLGFLGMRCDIHTKNQGGAIVHYLDTLDLPSIQFIDKLGLCKIGNGNRPTNLKLGPDLSYLGTYGEISGNNNILCTGFFEYMTSDQLYKWSLGTGYKKESKYTPYQIGQIVAPEQWRTNSIINTQYADIANHNYYLGYIDNHTFIPTVLLYYGDSSQEIPDTVRIIAGRACFGDLVKYKRFKLPRALTCIGYEAFGSPVSVDYTYDSEDVESFADEAKKQQERYACKIQSFYWIDETDEDVVEYDGLPTSLKYVADRAFMGCKAPVDLSGDNIQILDIGADAFTDSGVTKVKILGPQYQEFTYTESDSDYEDATKPAVTCTGSFIALTDTITVAIKGKSYDKSYDVFNISRLSASSLFSYYLNNYSPYISSKTNTYWVYKAKNTSISSISNINDFDNYGQWINTGIIPRDHISKKISNVEIFSGIKTIPSRAFYNAALLEYIEFDINNKLTSIGNSYVSAKGYTFEGESFYNTKLTKLDISENINNITAKSFHHNLLLDTINVSLQNHNYYSQDNCLIEFGTYHIGQLITHPFGDLPKDPEYPERQYYYYALHKAYKGDKLITGCKTSIIPLHISIIGSWAFESVDFINNAALRDLNLAESNITYIEEYSFLKCQGLLTLKLNQDTLTMLIGNNAFDECRNLMSVLLPDNQKTDDVSVSLDSNTTITIPEEKVHCTIGSNIFYNCIKLVEFIKPANLIDGPNKSYDYKFKIHNELIASLAASNSSIYQGYYDFSYYATDIITDSKNSSLKVTSPNNGVKIYYQSGSKAYKIVNCVIIPNECENTNIEISTASIIDKLNKEYKLSLHECAFAFMHPYVKSIKLCSKITKIPLLCFAYNSDIRNIYITNAITAIDASAFYDFTGDLNLYLKDESATYINYAQKTECQAWDCCWNKINFGDTPTIAYTDMNGTSQTKPFDNIYADEDTYACLYKIGRQTKDDDTNKVASNPLSSTDYKRCLYICNNSTNLYSLVNFIWVVEKEASDSEEYTDLKSEWAYHNCFGIKGVDINYFKVPSNDDLNKTLDKYLKCFNTVTTIVPELNGGYDRTYASIWEGLPSLKALINSEDLCKNLTICDNCLYYLYYNDNNKPSNYLIAANILDASAELLDISETEVTDVTILPYAFSYNTDNIKKIKLGSNITNLSDRAFAFMTNLEEINIPKSVTDIGAYCFYQCENLKDVIFEHHTPADFEMNADLSRPGLSLHEYAFKNCKNLEKIALFRVNSLQYTEGLFEGCSKLHKIFFDVRYDKDLRYGLSDISAENLKALKIDNSKLDAVFYNYPGKENALHSSLMSVIREGFIFYDIKIYPDSGLKFSCDDGEITSIVTIKPQSAEIFFPIDLDLQRLLNYRNITLESASDGDDVNILIDFDLNGLDFKDETVADILKVDTLYIHKYRDAYLTQKLQISKLSALAGLKNLYLEDFDTLEVKDGFDLDTKDITTDLILPLANVYYKAVGAYEGICRWISSGTFLKRECNLISRTSQTKFYLPDADNDTYIELAEYMKNTSSDNGFEINLDHISDSGSSFSIKNYVLAGYNLSGISLYLDNSNKCGGTIGAEAFADTQLAGLVFTNADSPWSSELKIKSKAFYNHKFKELLLPRSISIEDDAFSTQNANSITSARIPSHILVYLAQGESNTPASSIENLTLSNGSLSDIINNLTQIRGSDSTISEYPFDKTYWPKLETVSASDESIALLGAAEWENEDGKFNLLKGIFANSAIQSISISNLSDFDKIKALQDKSISIEIPEKFCYNSDQLQTIAIIPFIGAVKVIGNSAFEGCAALQDFNNLGPNIEYIDVEYIGDSAFEGCSNISDAIISHATSLRVLGDRAFANCTNIKELSIPNSVASIGTEAFNGTGLTNSSNITLPDNLIDIKADAFNNTILKIGKHLLRINPDSDITTLDLSELSEDDILTIADEACTKNSNITEVILPASIKLIGTKAFNNFTALTTISIDEGTDIDIQVIREDAFGSNISSFTLNNKKYLLKADTAEALTDDVVLIGDKACGNVDIKHIPKSVKYIGKDAFKETTDGYLDKWLLKAKSSNLKAINNESVYRIVDNTVAIADGAFADLGSQVNKIIIPNNTLSIGYNAFLDCRNLSTVDIYSYNPSGDYWRVRVPASVEYYADYDPYFSQGFEYAVTGNKVSITGLGTCTDSYISIPPTIKRLPVISINNIINTQTEQIRGIKINHSDISIAAEALVKTKLPNLEYINFATNDIPTFTDNIVELPAGIIIEVPGGVVSTYKENSELQAYKDNIYAQHFTLALEKDLDFKFTNICNALRRGFTAIGAEGTTDQGENVQVLRTYTVAEIAQELNNLIDAFNEKLEIKEI